MPDSHRSWPPRGWAAVAACACCASIKPTCGRNCPTAGAATLPAKLRPPSLAATHSQGGEGLPSPHPRSIDGTRPRCDGRTALDLALATHEEGEQGAEEEANPMALPPESALVLSLLQQMEDEQFEADEQAAVAEVEAQAATEVEHAVRRSSEALSPTQRK